MNPRTYESHMEWEYQGSGPQDPSSPFTHAAAAKKGTSTGFGGFSSPSKASSRPNPFANLPSTPSSKPLPQLPKASVFTPQLASKVTAPPFRNPAFTTPRRPADEVIFSEASGAEDSPGMSDAPNDTPEVDHMGDVTMGGMLSPSRIDKSSRYSKSVFAKKSGKGELRTHRDPVKAGLLRKRKRHNLDKDVGSVVRYQEPDSDESGMDSDSSRVFRGGRSRSKKRPDAPVKRGFFGSIFHMLDEHPNAPENLHRWIQLFLNLVFISTIVGIAYTIYSTIRSDILTANEAARTELADKIAECARNFQVNGCADNTRPALVAICDEWAICLSQRPEAIMRVKVTVKQIAEIINEFSDAMNFKAWGFFFAVLVVCVFSNNMMLGRQESSKPPAVPQPSGPANIPEDPSVMWMPVATPRMKRQAMLEDGSDTDASPKPQPMLAYYTPSSRRSPTKSDRARSPVKSQRSPSKAY